MVFMFYSNLIGKMVLIKTGADMNGGQSVQGLYGGYETQRRKG